VRILRIISVTAAAAAILMAGTQFRSTPVQLVPVVHAESGCSNGSLRGSYGFQIKGTIVGFGPIGGVARLVFDGAGNFTQTDNVTVNGFPIVPNRPGNGTYIVNPDCTGTQTLNTGGQVLHTSFVLAENGKEVFDIVTDLTDPHLVNPHLVITGIGKRVASADDNEDDDSSAPECSFKTIKGSYATSTTGSIVFAGPVGLVADVGKIVFDGNGGAAQTTAVSINGVIIPNRSSLSGTYTMNPDCTGDISLVLPGATGTIMSTFHFVVVHNGEELLTINSGVGRVLTGIADRQHSRSW
jgi:hypothetical protein